MGEWIKDYNWVLYRGYYKDPFPHSYKASGSLGCKVQETLAGSWVIVIRFWEASNGYRGPFALNVQEL